MTMIDVTVTGAGSLFGQGIIKCLRIGDMPARIHGLDYFKAAVGFNWCDDAGVLPDLLDAEVAEDTWFDALCRAVDAARSRVLFVGVDFELQAIAQRGEELRDRTGCCAVVSAPHVIATCKDKYRTAQWLREIGELAPDTFLPGVDLDRVEAAIGYPMIVKPRFGSRSRGLARVDDRAALERSLGDCAQPVIQRYLPGDDNEYTCGVVVLDGRIDTVAVLRRQLKDGNTSSAVADPQPAIAALCRRVGDALTPYGPINIQLRLVDGEPIVFEINPRFSGTTIFRAHLGINEPVRVLRHALGMSLAPSPSLRRGRVQRYFDEIVAFDDSAEPGPLPLAAHAS